MNNHELFSNFFADKFTNDYIEDSNSELRLGLSMIAIWCEQINSSRSKVVKEELTGNIIKKCCQLMKDVELRSIMRVVSKENIGFYAFSIKEYLKTFMKNSGAVVTDRCNFILECDDDRTTVISSNEEVLSFVLLMQVRYALANKADTIKFSYVPDENFVSLNIAYSVNEEIEDLDVDDIIIEELGVLSEYLCGKIRAEYSREGNNMTIKIPFAEENEVTCTVKKIDSRNFFNVYSYMLSDFTYYEEID